MCTSCAAKNRLATAEYAAKYTKVREVFIQEDCVFTVEELEEKLKIANETENWIQVSILKSAIATYHRNCNAFVSSITI